MSEHVAAETVHAYLDGEMERDERRRVDDHLAACGACADLVGAVGRVVAAVRRLPAEAVPPRDLWTGIEARMETPGGARPRTVSGAGRRGPRRLAFTLPQLWAAGIAVALASAGGMWYAAGTPRALGEHTLLPVPGEQVVHAAGREAPPEYRRAVSELERTLEEGRHLLDPATVATLERSLAAIDRALAEAGQALARDPGSDVLNRMVGNHRQQRLRVLQQAAARLGET